MNTHMSVFYYFLYNNKLYYLDTIDLYSNMFFVFCLIILTITDGFGILSLINFAVMYIFLVFHCFIKFSYYIKKIFNCIKYEGRLTNHCIFGFNDDILMFKMQYDNIEKNFYVFKEEFYTTTVRRR